jgi:hypothetical protein
MASEREETPTTRQTSSASDDAVGTVRLTAAENSGQAMSLVSEAAYGGIRQ